MAIRNSLNFSFNGRNSTEFGIFNVNVGSGMLEEVFTPTRNIKEVKVAGNDKPYHQGIEYEPLEFDLTFAFKNKFDRDTLRKVARWLSTDYYKPLSFSEHPEKIFYAMFINASDLVHTGADQGYIKLSVRCDSPYSYSSYMIDPVIDLSANVAGGTTVYFENLGDTICRPEMNIVKVGNGDISIINLLNNNIEFKFTGLINNEEVYVNNERKQINTSLLNTYRFNNFNNNFLELLPYTISQLKVTGNCKIQFRYQFKYLH